MARGYTTVMQEDGLIVVKPRRPASSPALSVRAVVMFLGAFVLFKGVAMANLGIGSYEERLMRLQFGNPAERIGALAMFPDPLSELVARNLRHLHR